MSSAYVPKKLRQQVAVQSRLVQAVLALARAVHESRVRGVATSRTFTKRKTFRPAAWRRRAWPRDTTPESSSALTRATFSGDVSIRKSMSLVVRPCPWMTRAPGRARAEVGLRVSPAAKNAAFRVRAMPT